MMWIDLEVSIVMGVSQYMDGFCKGKSHLEMDDDFGVPPFMETPKCRRVQLSLALLSDFLA